MQKLLMLKQQLTEANLYDKYAQYLGGQDKMDIQLASLADDLDDDYLDEDIPHFVQVIKNLLDKNDRRQTAINYRLLSVTPIWITDLGDGSVEWWITKTPDGKYKYESDTGYTAQDIAKVLRNLADLIDE